MNMAFQSVGVYVRCRVVSVEFKLLTFGKKNPGNPQYHNKTIDLGCLLSRGNVHRAHLPPSIFRGEGLHHSSTEIRSAAHNRSPPHAFPSRPAHDQLGRLAIVESSSRGVNLLSFCLSPDDWVALLLCVASFQGALGIHVGLHDAPLKARAWRKALQGQDHDLGRGRHAVGQGRSRGRRLA